MGFGIKPETPKAICWGARALYEKNYDPRTGKNYDRRGPYTFALLWDRQQIEGGTEKEQKAFLRWINKKGLPALQRVLRKDYPAPNDRREVSLELDGYRVVANPMASHGYLYIGIYPLADAPAVEEAKA